MYIELLLLIWAAAGRNGGLLKFGFVLSIPLMLIGFTALIITIIKFVQMFRAAQISRIPLSERGEIDITEIGDLNLCLQAPTLAVFPGQELNYRLVNQNNGQEIKLNKVSPRSVSRRHSFSAITFPVRNFKVADAAKYLLIVSGFNPQRDYSSYFLIIEKPTSTKSVLYILTIILTGGMTLLGFALTIFLLNAR